MSSGEASRFSADETNQNGMPAHHSPERRGALHPQHHLSSPQPSGGMEYLSKKHVQALHLTRCLHWPPSAMCLKSSLLSEMPSKGDHVANGEKKGGGVMICMRVSQANCDVGVKRCTQPLQLWPLIFLGAGRKGEEDWWRVPRAHTDISLFPIISPLWHLTAGREAASKRRFIKPIKGEKEATQSPNKLLSHFVSFSHPYSFPFPFPPVSIMFSSLLPLLLSLPVPSCLFPMFFPRHPYRDPALFTGPQKHLAPLNSTFKQAAAVFQWPVRGTLASLLCHQTALCHITSSKQPTGAGSTSRPTLTQGPLALEQREEMVLSSLQSCITARGYAF